MFSKEELHTCTHCKDTFSRKWMLETSDGTGYCIECFKKRFYRPSGDQKEKDDLRNKLIPYPEIFSLRRRQALGIKSTNHNVGPLSKKPLQCPRADCNKFISIFTLESHFKYEHKEVPIILTQLDARSALEFYSRDVRYGVTQCIVLLNVINHDFSGIMPRTSTYCSKTNLQTNNSKPIMILLATRLPGHQLDSNLENQNDINDDAESSKTFTTFMEETRDMRPEDKMIIWLASNVFTNFSYTVAVSTFNNKIRQKYVGPMLTLGSNPLDLYKDGNCLTLTHFHINGMSEHGSKPLALDVVIHGPD